MRFMQFYRKQDASKAPEIGVCISDSTIYPLRFDGNMRRLIEKLADQPEWADEIRFMMKDEDKYISMEDVHILPTLDNPDKIICIGLNYRDHALEANMPIPEKPILFPKYNNCLIGHEESVIIPKEVTECDYEVELAFVIGRKAKRVSPEEALDYVFGYTVMNDVSARDLQLTEGQWTRGKTIDTFAPIGPWIVTADEIPDPHSLDISLSLNGKEMQRSNTKELIFNVPYIVSFLSQTMTLLPGDMISTGTPFGVGMGRSPQVWLKDGDVTEATVQGIGTLRNRFVAE